VPAAALRGGSRKNVAACGFVAVRAHGQQLIEPAGAFAEGDRDFAEGSLKACGGQTNLIFSGVVRRGPDQFMVDRADYEQWGL
jgi:hypothetical protein